MNDLMKRLLQIAKENPHGFTVEIPTCRPVKKGWVVAMIETQNCFGIEGLKKVLQIANETTKIVGGWKDEQFYWDAVMTFDD